MAVKIVIKRNVTEIRERELMPFLIQLNHTMSQNASIMRW